jgi:hypothetical protein
MAHAAVLLAGYQRKDNAMHKESKNAELVGYKHPPRSTNFVQAKAATPPGDRKEFEASGQICTPRLPRSPLTGRATKRS